MASARAKNGGWIKWLGAAAGGVALAGGVAALFGAPSCGELQTKADAATQHQGLKDDAERDHLRIYKRLDDNQREIIELIKSRR